MAFIRVVTGDDSLKQVPPGLHMDYPAGNRHRNNRLHRFEKLPGRPVGAILPRCSMLVQPLPEVALPVQQQVGIAGSIATSMEKGRHSGNARSTGHKSPSWFKCYFVPNNVCTLGLVPRFALTRDMQ